MSGHLTESGRLDEVARKEVMARGLITTSLSSAQFSSVARHTEGELPGGFRRNARLRDSGDSGPKGEDQKHFSELFKMRFRKELHKRIIINNKRTQTKSAHVQGVRGVHEGFMRDS